MMAFGLLPYLLVDVKSRLDCGISGLYASIRGVKSIGSTSSRGLGADGFPVENELPGDFSMIALCNSGSEKRGCPISNGATFPDNTPSSMQTRATPDCPICQQHARLLRTILMRQGDNLPSLLLLSASLFFRWCARLFACVCVWVSGHVLKNRM